MGGGTDKLSDAKVRAFVKAATAGKAATRKLSDGGGLYVTVTDAGTPAWRIKYRYAGKEKLFAVGVYPEVTLEAARAKRTVVRAQLRDGRDPMVERQLSRATNADAAQATFESVALAWIEKQKPAWSEIHYRQSKRALERDAFPMLGKLPIDGIRTPMIARMIESIGKRGAHETAAKLLWNVQRIFDYAKTREGTTLAENPAIAAREVLEKRRKYTPHPAILNFEGLGEVLRRIETAPISPAVRMAHRLTAFTAQRIGNVVTAEWSQFKLDGDTPMWIIPRGTMKVRVGRNDHKVILGPTIAEELRAWRQVTGGEGFLFRPNSGDRPHITREALEKGYRKTFKLDGQHSVHGWRASFSTLAREEGGFEREVVELALDHIHASETVRAYDRGERRTKRIELARWWNSRLESSR